MNTVMKINTLTDNKSIRYAVDRYTILHCFKKI